MTFVAWLDQERLHDVQLRWYLDYCCRDDYGAGITTVSAWAGIQYFASRHGFHLPDDAPTERGAVLTWPEGNGWITRRLAAPMAGRLHAGKVVVRIAQGRHGVEVDAFDPAAQLVERWQAQHCIVALPVLVAARVVASPPAFLQAAAARLRYAPWVVANVHLRAPLDDRPGAAPAWDNVLYGAGGLGYVNARHQSTDQAPGPTVLTWYCAPGEASRRAVLERSWVSWREQVIAELHPAHPDLAAKATRMDVTRYGHAMAIPVPGSRATLAQAGLRAGRLSFAHSDWAGYSVFEEAFSLGHRAGAQRDV